MVDDNTSSHSEEPSFSGAGIRSTLLLLRDFRGMNMAEKLRPSTERRGWLGGAEGGLGKLSPIADGLGPGGGLGRGEGRGAKTGWRTS